MQRADLFRTVLAGLRPFRRLPIWARFAIATAVVAAFYALGVALYPTLAAAPLLLFVVAVLLIAFAFDRGSGFYATLLAAALSARTFKFPTTGAGLQIGSWLAIFLFTAIGLFSAALIEALRLTIDELGDDEEALARSEARQRELLATLDLGAFMSLAPFDRTILFWSAGCERLYGWTAAEALGRSAHDLLCTVFPMPPEEIQACLERDNEWSGDLRHRTRSGEEIIVLVRMALRRNEAGDPVAVMESLADVTAHRRAEAALAESEAQFRRLVEATPQLVFTALPDGFIDFCNEKWRVFTGLSDCNRWVEAVHPEDLARTDEAWRRALDTGKAFEIENRFRGVDGLYRHLLTRAVPLRNAEGRILRWFGASTDISEVVAAREVLARDKAELERLVEARSRELEEARARAAHSERMQALGQLASGMAHDFKNVLHAVQGGVGLIEKRAGGNEEIRQLADMITEAVGRGSAITRRLLAFSRRSELQAEAVDPAALFEGLGEVLDHTLGGRIEVRMETPANLPPLWADKGQLETVLINLATNARDAMPAGGVLTFAAALETVTDAHAPDVALRPHPYVRLSVTDTGAGMAPEVLARVTEPFFTTKGEGEGTGLGLAMAKDFAEQSGGALHIDSALGRGTVVTLWFPLASRAGFPAQGAYTGGVRGGAPGRGEPGRTPGPPPAT